MLTRSAITEISASLQLNKLFIFSRSCFYVWTPLYWFCLFIIVTRRRVASFFERYWGDGGTSTRYFQHWNCVSVCQLNCKYPCNVVFSMIQFKTSNKIYNDKWKPRWGSSTNCCPWMFWQNAAPLKLFFPQRLQNCIASGLKVNMLYMSNASVHFPLNIFNFWGRIFLTTFFSRAN